MISWMIFYYLGKEIAVNIHKEIISFIITSLLLNVLCQLLIHI